MNPSSFSNVIANILFCSYFSFLYFPFSIPRPFVKSSIIFIFETFQSNPQEMKAMNSDNHFFNTFASLALGHSSDQKNFFEFSIIGELPFSRIKTYLFAKSLGLVGVNSYYFFLGIKTFSYKSELSSSFILPPLELLRSIVTLDRSFMNENPNLFLLPNGEEFLQNQLLFPKTTASLSTKVLKCTETRSSSARITRPPWSSFHGAGLAL